MFQVLKYDYSHFDKQNSNKVLIIITISFLNTMSIIFIKHKKWKAHLKHELTNTTHVPVFIGSGVQRLAVTATFLLPPPQMQE